MMGNAALSLLEPKTKPIGMCQHDGCTDTAMLGIDYCLKHKDDVFPEPPDEEDDDYDLDEEDELDDEEDWE